MVSFVSSQHIYYFDRKHYYPSGLIFQADLYLPPSPVCSHLYIEFSMNTVFLQTKIRTVLALNHPPQFSSTIPKRKTNNTILSSIRTAAFRYFEPWVHNWVLTQPLMVSHRDAMVFLRNVLGIRQVPQEILVLS